MFPAFVPDFALPLHFLLLNFCCRFHRILDLRTFRWFLRTGLIPVDGFLSIVSADREQTLLPGLVTADNITDFFADYGEWDVSVPPLTREMISNAQ